LLGVTVEVGVAVGTGKQPPGATVLKDRFGHQTRPLLFGFRLSLAFLLFFLLMLFLFFLFLLTLFLLSLFAKLGL
jgi:hypothetical protein